MQKAMMKITPHFSLLLVCGLYYGQVKPFLYLIKRHAMNMYVEVEV
jgi:hypothetical protein